MLQDTANSFTIARATVFNEILEGVSEDLEVRLVLQLFQKINLLVLSVVRIANDHEVSILEVSLVQQMEEASLIIIPLLKSI